jgi:hypothetical protein
MSIRWFSALGSPSYLATVLHRYYRPAVNRSVFCTISSSIMYQHCVQDGSGWVQVGHGVCIVCMAGFGAGY